MRRFVPILGLLLVTACDNAKKADVEGLQQRLDAIAAEQTALDKQVDDLAAKVDDPKALEQVKAELAAAKSELADIGARVKKLEEVPKPGVPTPRPGSPDPAARYKVKVDDAFVRGVSDAKVTLVIFSDFQCPFCARVQPTIRDLEKHYGSDLRFVAKHNPLAFHNKAELAAQAAEAAGKQGKFFEMHDRLYENARDITDAKIADWAKELKLDVSKLKRDMDSTEVLDRVKAHKEQAATLGARGTPAFFVNGRYLSGAQPFDAFKKLIDEELAEADRRIASGTARASVYDTLMATAKEKP
jgi:protein-disulfide isomerase